jgi:hypothetical protein
MPPHALAWLEFICKRVRFRFYICLYLFEKVLDLESISIRIVFYYLHEKYDNSISMNLTCFKRTLHKIEGIKKNYFDLLGLTWKFLGFENKRDTNFFMLRTEIVFQM